MMIIIMMQHEVLGHPADLFGTDGTDTADQPPEEPKTPFGQARCNLFWKAGQKYYYSSYSFT